MTRSPLSELDTSARIRREPPELLHREHFHSSRHRRSIGFGISNQAMVKHPLISGDNDFSIIGNRSLLRNPGRLELIEQFSFV